jgi:hypothetical protein
VTRTDSKSARAGAVREVPLAHDGEVSIAVAAGAVRLHGSDESIVRVATLDGEPLEDFVAIDAEPGRVTVTAREEGRRLGPLSFSSGRSVDLDIQVPRRATVTVRTASGDVDAKGLAGPTRWTTASGDLVLALDGGGIAIQTVSGDVRLEATVPVSLEARTVSGNLRVRAPGLLGMRVESISGDIELAADLEPGRAHEVGTVSGDVVLATDSPVRLETRTVAGEVEASVPHRTEGGRGRRLIVVGAGSVSVGVRTMSGGIALRPGRPAAPTAAPAPPAPPSPVSSPLPPVPAPLFAAAGDAPTDRQEVARLEVLRALERGALDVDAATRRLEALEEAGPRAFRGWV